MLITSTTTIPEYQITQYKNMVFGECSKSIVAFFKSAEAYTKEVGELRHRALQEMQNNATNLGANAIIGVTFDYLYVESDDTLVVTCSGTAVVIA